jgi:hypothetical protein
LKVFDDSEEEENDPASPSTAPAFMNFKSEEENE